MHQNHGKGTAGAPSPRVSDDSVEVCDGAWQSGNHTLGTMSVLNVWEIKKNISQGHKSFHEFSGSITLHFSLTLYPYIFKVRLLCNMIIFLLNKHLSSSLMGYVSSKNKNKKTFFLTNYMKYMKFKMHTFWSSLHDSTVN